VPAEKTVEQLAEEVKTAFDTKFAEVKAADRKSVV
jgi:hypothetical protein